MALCLLIFASLCSWTIAAITIDPAFGTNGHAIFHYTLEQFGGAERTYGAEIFVQPTGRLIAVCKHESPGIVSAARSIGVIGILSNGDIDPTYGTAGKTVLHVPGGGYNNNYYGSKMLADGRLLILREISPIKGVPRLDLTRLGINGLIDVSFAPTLSLGNGTTRAYGFDVLADGRIMVVLWNDSPFSFYLLRLNESGARDPTFGTDGLKKIHINYNSGPYHNFVDFAVGPDGKAVIAFIDGTLIRFDKDGNLDRTLVTQGTTLPFPARPIFLVNKLKILPDGKCLLIGSSGNIFSGINPGDLTIVRVTRRGKPDGAFGQGGIVVSDVQPDGRGAASNILVLPDGKMIVIGSYSAAGTTAFSIFVGQFSENGDLLDYTQTQFPTSAANSLTSIAFRSDNRFVAVGTATFSSQLSKMDVVQIISDTQVFRPEVSNKVHKANN